MTNDTEGLRHRKDYAEPHRSYQEYDREITGIFAKFEIAAQDYVRNYGKVSDKTSSKRIDAARREAFEAITQRLREAEAGLRSDIAYAIGHAQGCGHRMEYLEKRYPELVKKKGRNDERSKS